MKFLKKNLPVLAVATGIGATIITTTAVYFSTGTGPTILEQKRYAIRYNKPLSINGYYFDETDSYGTTKDKYYITLTNANLVRMEASGETVVEKIGTEGKTKVTKPSYSRLKFELASSIIIEYQIEKEGKKVIEYQRFDKDDADIVKPLKEGAKMPPAVKKISNDPKSINSEFFDKMLSSLYLNKDNTTTPIKIKSVNFTVKKDMYWVDWQGNYAKNSKGKKYQIVPDDFHYSFLRSKLGDATYRNSIGGGNTKLDEYFIKKTKTNNNFSPEKAFQNEYLFDFFGADSIRLAKHDQAVRDLSKPENSKIKAIINPKTDYTKSTFSIYTNRENDKEPKWLDGYGLMNKQILNSNLLIAAPSQYLEDLEKDEAINKTPVGEIPKGSKVRKYGSYTYAQDRKSTLFAGPYTPFEAKDNRVVFRRNKNFSGNFLPNKNGDLEYVEDKTRAYEFILEYVAKPLNKATYNDQAFNSFTNKTLSEVNFNELSPSQRKVIWGDGTPKEYLSNGLLFTKKINTSSLIQQTMPVGVPAPKPKSSARDASKPPYYYNDTYAKVVYGATRDELWNSKKSTTDAYYAGYGLYLRSYINAAINWYTFIQNTSSGSKIAWINHSAQDAKYSAKNPNTPWDDYEIVNSGGYIKKVKKDDGTTDETIEYVQMEDLKTQWEGNQSSKEIQVKSKNFTTIQSLVTSMLDEAYQKLNLSPDEKLQWDIWYGEKDQNEAIVNEMKFVAENVIAKLDTKGRLAPTVRMPSINDFSIANKKSYATADYSGWGYDYEGIGSFLDAVTHLDGVNLIGLIGKMSYLEDTDKLCKLFPNFKIFSDFMTKEFEAPKYKPFFDDPEGAKMHPKHWATLTNGELFFMEDNFKEISTRLMQEGKISKIIAFREEISKFCFNFQEAFKEDFSKEIGFKYLIRELNIIQGTSLEAGASIDDPGAAGLMLVQDGYEYPTAYGPTLYLHDIRIKERDKK